MKIRTRIIWICCAAVLAASLLGDAVIWVLVRQSFQDEAFIKAYQKAYAFMDEFRQTLAGDAELADSTVFLQYYFKTRGDDYNICFQRSRKYGSEESQPEEIYNQTVIDAESLFNLDYRSRENWELEYCNLKWEGKHYVVLSKQLSDGLIYFRIEDISYVWDKMKWLTVCLLAISLAAAFVVICAISVILKRVLQPLQELNETTKHMAEGFYDQRLHILRQDEIGQLGENFNKMAEAVEARTRSLEESEKKKTLFMGNLTHELKTPMTAITGYAQTLLAARLSEEQQQEALLYIYEECARLERLSRKMMKLLELDQEEELELTEMPVRCIFEAAAKACGAILREKQIVLEVLEQGETFPMDADLMTDVLVNLIDNAVKASEQGGRIILKAYGNFIEVEDFGRGIPESEQEKILEPFYMIDKSRSRKSGGAGLGLALTAMIAKAHDISLKIVSEEGKGTRMILQFV